MQDKRNDLDDGFGHWLAGFVDGEGSFNLLRSGHGCYPRFSIDLRDDDLEILQAIQARTGVGRISFRSREAATRGPIAVWDVRTRAGCVRLVEIFDCYPLRAKKARDYVVWREAVLEYARIQPQADQRGRRNFGPMRDWSRMIELREQLMTGRKYDNASVVVPPRAQPDEWRLFEEVT